MSKDNVIAWSKRVGTPIADPLTEVLQRGARRLLAEAVETEVEQFLAQHQGLIDEAGRARVVRNGYLPPRAIQTVIGEVEVEVPRVRDRGGAQASEAVRFGSAIIPRYLRKSASLEELIPCLYLKGISTGDFQEALKALMGERAEGFSAATVSRLKAGWIEEVRRWQKRDLTGKPYVYFWADGIDFGIRAEHERACALVVIGATAQGEKELVALEEGFRESTESGRDLLADLKARGLERAPALAIGDGALGFWKALTDVYPTTAWQRCWVHKTANVLHKLPHALQDKAKADVQEIGMAENRADAEKACQAFIERYGAQYPKAAECLSKDRDTLLRFYDFPAEHWVHIRTTNPIESTFATVRLRTDKTRGCVTRLTFLALVFQLLRSAQQRWRRLTGSEQLAEVIRGVAFVDGVRADQRDKLNEEDANLNQQAA
ncbi:MAG: IS256 family transposase [Gammaproteobacteria bacterium]